MQCLYIAVTVMGISVDHTVNTVESSEKKLMKWTFELGIFCHTAGVLLFLSVISRAWQSW